MRLHPKDDDSLSEVSVLDLDEEDNVEPPEDGARTGKRFLEVRELAIVVCCQLTFLEDLQLFPRRPTKLPEKQRFFGMFELSFTSEDVSLKRRNFWIRCRKAQHKLPHRRRSAVGQKWRRVDAMCPGVQTFTLRTCHMYKFPRTLQDNGADSHSFHERASLGL